MDGPSAAPSGIAPHPSAATLISRLPKPSLGSIVDGSTGARTRVAVTRSVIAVATSLSVAGCGSSGDKPAPCGDTTASASATMAGPDVQTPRPTSSIAPYPPTASLVLSTPGLGPLTIGLPPKSNPGAQMIVFDPKACAGAAEGSELGRWTANYPPYTDADGSSKPLFAVDVNDSHGVYWIDVLNPAIKTSAGIHVGSTLDALKAAYPGLVKGTPGPTSQPWWVSDAAGTLSFEVQDSSQGLQPEGTPPVVVLIHVQAPGVDADWTAANSGNIAGSCE